VLKQKKDKTTHKKRKKKRKEHFKYIEIEIHRRKVYPGGKFEAKKAVFDETL